MKYIILSLLLSGCLSQLVLDKESPVSDDTGHTDDTGDSGDDTNKPDDTDDSGDTGDSGDDTGDTGPVDADHDGYTEDVDCDDSDASVHPDAEEVCNEIDDNCDGNVDEGVKITFYVDADHDGYGDATVSAEACTAPSGYVLDDTDCDDAEPDANPGIEEICGDEFDNDCDDDIDEDVDLDGDGYTTCDGDCDDGDTLSYPGATEVCDLADNDCDDDIDEDATDFSTFYADYDSDGYGDASVSTEACTAPSGYVLDNTDCNDSDASVNPDADEVCNEVDDNCDGDIDEDSAIDATTWYADNDRDRFGDSGSSTVSCEAPSGYVEDDTDCDDSDASVNPDASETCNGIDDDCDGTVDEDVDDDGDGYTTCDGDCDDSDASVNPDASETCNGIDDDCDGEVDDGLTVVSYFNDYDGDGYGDASVSTEACTAPSGYVLDNTDCDDDNADVNPDASETCNDIDDDCDGEVDDGLTVSDYFNDYDSDGYGDASVSTEACTAPSGYVLDDTDCNDDNADVNPGEDEYCDGVDNNCDGDIDEDSAVDATTWYADNDRDRFGDVTVSTVSCDEPSGYVADDTDCDDSDASVNPDASETCNGIDDDCDGTVDEDVDLDGDGYTTCSGDCDDSDASVNPDASETCNGIDDDCDGEVDDGLTVSDYFYDYDSDGYGDAATSVEACTAPSGYVLDNTDCDDDNADVNPGEDEYCDGVDNNCDGDVDETDAVDTTTWYADADEDGYGDATVSAEACTAPSGYVLDDTDCDDSDDTSYPGATEECDGVDNDCDGVVDESADDDGDSYTICDGDCDDSDTAVYPGATDDCDGVDNNCDGDVDEGGVCTTELCWKTSGGFDGGELDEVDAYGVVVAVIATAATDGVDETSMCGDVEVVPGDAIYVSGYYNWSGGGGSSDIIDKFGVSGGFTFDGVTASSSLASYSGTYYAVVTRP